MNKIITISRQYSSGGREIGKKLAKELQIPYYDKEIIQIAAKESGYAIEAFANVEKKATNSLLYSIARGISGFGANDASYSTMSLDDNIYLATASVIRKVADEGPCVIVGRCANYILRDYENALNVFIWADMEFRKNRAMDIHGQTPDNVEDFIIKCDKQRANYYNFHTSEKWGKTENYHLSIRSSLIGIDNCVRAIIDYAEMAEAYQNH